MRLEEKTEREHRTDVSASEDNPKCKLCDAKTIKFLVLNVTNPIKRKKSINHLQIYNVFSARICQEKSMQLSLLGALTFLGESLNSTRITRMQWVFTDFYLC